MQITRSDVIRAVRSETLWPESWVEEIWNPGCRVCALGAVLRQQGLANRQIIYMAQRAAGCDAAHDSDLDEALGQEQWLRALSIQFERLCTPTYALPDDEAPVYIEKTVKPALLQWVMATLPDGVLWSGEL